MEKELRFARNKGREMVKGCKYQGICTYGYTAGDGFVKDTNHACHAGLLSTPRMQFTDKVEYVIDIIYKDRISSALYINFIDFIMNTPAYQGVLVQRKAKAAYKEGYLIANTTVPSNQLSNCLFSLRMAYERPKMIETWAKLVDMGIDKDVAYILCHTLLIKEDTALLTEPQYHHIGLEITEMGIKAAYNFLDGVLSKQHVNPPYNQDFDYHPSGLVFGCKADKCSSLYKTIYQYIKGRMKEEKVKKEPVYLFHKVDKIREKERGNIFPLNEKLKQVLLQFNTEIKEKKL